MNYCKVFAPVTRLDTIQMIIAPDLHKKENKPNGC